MSDIDKIVEKTAKVIDDKKVEFKILTENCGHHCGAIGGIGTSHVSVGHCKCPECHDQKNFGANS